MTFDELIEKYADNVVDGMDLETMRTTIRMNILDHLGRLGEDTVVEEISLFEPELAIEYEKENIDTNSR